MGLFIYEVETEEEAIANIAKWLDIDEEEVTEEQLGLYYTV